MYGKQITNSPSHCPTETSMDMVLEWGNPINTQHTIA